ncbi:MAG: hypothetical protein INQ03_26000 [Candidatus Heimdallarchaeota archaeon]|nr:hypothetical protein [Candidatus Heimdallarchaeota archaeon]
MDHFFPKEPVKLAVLAEQVFRIIAVISSFFLFIDTKDNKYLNAGIILYCVGLFVYFSSWIALILIDVSKIDNYSPVLRAIVVFAPSYTPIIWMIGMALICNKLWFCIPSTLFIFAHVIHFYLIYQ